MGKTKVKGMLLAAGTSDQPVTTVVNLSSDKLAGHTCWGIQNGPATGKLISEFVFDGAAKSAKIDSLDPRMAM